ncbi:MAG: UDP-N-acetylmuramoyl-tripeptide--D-alanyl-D-alanine ligase [Flavobacteriales bacterium]|nr:UDP-N-acetylmuramoyl-tripeptide--D-alanyl-D-alanine ligase [Flavobacteriales bacterium]
MKIAELYQIYLKHPIISTDTRKITEGCIFFALRGDNFNANEFAQEAIDKGAAYVIVDEPQKISSSQCILVPDVLTTLQELANFHRNQFKIPFIGITGSNGKTTSKELVNAVLSQKYKTSFTQGNYNNHIGVPLTLLSIPLDCDIAIIEMGANHIGEIGALCEIAEPNYGVITNIGTAHIEGFGSREGIITGKSELYKFISKTNGTLFVNQNDNLLVSLSKEIKTVQYSTADISDFHFNPFITFNYKDVTISSQLYGEYNLPNILLAITVGEYFGVSVAQIKTALENYVSNNNRSQIVRLSHHTLYLDAYNANPSSMSVAIDSFNSIHSTNKLLILGDMLELGNVSEKEHQLIVDKIFQLSLTALFVGNEFQKITNKYNFNFVKNTDEAILFLESRLKNYSNILIKGSRGIRLEKVAEYIQKKEA